MKPYFETSYNESVPVKSNLDNTSVRSTITFANPHSTATSAKVEYLYPFIEVKVEQSSKNSFNGREEGCEPRALDVAVLMNMSNYCGVENM